VRRSVPELNVGEANREAAVPPDPAEIKGLLSKAASEKNKQGSIRSYKTYRTDKTNEKLPDSASPLGPIGPISRISPIAPAPQ
jgi:hypothetical protein